MAKLGTALMSLRDFVVATRIHTNDNLNVKSVLLAFFFLLLVQNNCSFQKQLANYERDPVDAFSKEIACIEFF